MGEIGQLIVRRREIRRYNPSDMKIKDRPLDHKKRTKDQA
jgi:hypothetical protein